MSRVGKKPIEIPAKTTVSYKDRVVTVKGAKGSLDLTVHPAVDLLVEDSKVNVNLIKDDKQSRAIQGLMRSLVANMIIGTDKGFEKILELNGIGYKAEVKGNQILFNLGFSHQISFELPESISATIDRKQIKLTGIDKEILGRTAASIRDLRPPEPYKGKGIKYLEERIIRKAGKTGAK